MSRYELGTVAASEALLQDLYVDLRTKLLRWAAVTHQTPQARMGYIGQHLTSVVTGFGGGRSGARGKDLVLPGGRHAEIKTCYRVDQLGQCRSCEAKVASVEPDCPSCGSEDIVRKDDSKWLIGVRNDDEMDVLFEPESYYLVLFDFIDLARARNINARIYEVDPKWRGFAYCMVDYYVNTWPNSTAPFNLWPFLPKFDVMLPTLIYHSILREDNSIDTLLFPGQRGTPVVLGPKPLTSYSRSRTVSAAVVRDVAARLGATLPSTGSKAVLLQRLEQHRIAQKTDDLTLATAMAEAIYGGPVANARHWLPTGLL